MSSEDRLLDTLVTWQDVEIEMQKSLGTTAKFGENRKCVNFGHMKGFMSRIALIEADWTHQKEELPEKFIVKISTALGVKDLFDCIDFLKDDSPKTEPVPEFRPETNQDIVDTVKQCHNRECKTYEIIEKEKLSTLPIIKIYAAKPFASDSTGGFLICEYIPNAIPSSLYSTIPYKNLLPVIDAIGAFSALGDRINEEDRKMMNGEEHLERGIRTFFPEAAYPKIRSSFLEALGEQFTEKIDKVMEILKLICSSPQSYTKLSEFLDIKPVLRHSDLWPSNLLLTRSLGNPDQLNFKALIDYQLCSFGTPGLDAAGFVVTCMNAKDRRNHTVDFLNQYYQSFKANLPENSLPYTFQQLQDSYNICYVPLALQITPFMWSMAKNKGVEEGLQMAREKMGGLIEDLIEVHEGNMKKFPTFFEV